MGSRNGQELAVKILHARRHSSDSSSLEGPRKMMLLHGANLMAFFFAPPLTLTPSLFSADSVPWAVFDAFDRVFRLAPGAMASFLK
mmetsp:Transcript_21182/g.86521  ORF Transcript_21182/g.86521 Transcript_21182/m.86521 type:complete len:86 (+) Transcript_21182:3982-4239(+)